MSEQTFIYSLADPRTGVVKYIGKTRMTLMERFSCHVSAKNNKKQKSPVNDWILSLRRLELRPIMEIVDIVPTSEWQFWEIYWIAQFKNWGFKLKNMSEGGHGGDPTPEVREKVSKGLKKYFKEHPEAREALSKRHTKHGKTKAREDRKKQGIIYKAENHKRGQDHYLYGKPFPEETKRKMLETKAKNPLKHSEEHKKYLSDLFKGRKGTNDKIVYRISLEDKKTILEEFALTKDIISKYGYDLPKSINKIVRTNKIYKNKYLFIYKDEYENFIK